MCQKVCHSLSTSPVVSTSPSAVLGLTTPGAPRMPGDIVFLGSDGVADNFDPIVLKKARAAPYASEVGGQSVSQGWRHRDGQTRWPRHMLGRAVSLFFR